MGMIKTLICSELGIPVCKQELSGWKLDRQPRDTTVLESLNLPKENTLYLSVNTDERDAATEEYESVTLLPRLSKNEFVFFNQECCSDDPNLQAQHI